MDIERRKKMEKTMVILVVIVVALAGCTTISQIETGANGRAGPREPSRARLLL